MDDFTVDKGVIYLDNKEEDIEILLNEVSINGTSFRELRYKLEYKIPLKKTINKAIDKGYLIRYSNGVYFLCDEILNEIDREEDEKLVTLGEVTVVVKYLISKASIETVEEEDVKEYLALIKEIGTYYIEDKGRVDYKEIRNRIKSYISKVQLMNMTSELIDYVEQLNHIIKDEPRII